MILPLSQAFAIWPLWLAIAGAIEPPPPDHQIGFRAGAGFLVDHARDVNPEVGYGFGLTFRTTLWRVPEMRVMASADFGHDRFVDGTEVVQPVTEQNRSQLVLTSFAPGLLVTLSAGPVTPWFGAGAGISICHYAFHDADPALDRESRAVLPLVSAHAGIDVPLFDAVAGTLRVAYAWLPNDTEIEQQGVLRRPFGDVLTIALGGAYSF